MAKINTKKYEVPAAKLRWRCDEQSVPFASTKEVEAGDKVIGQDRAVEALEVGLTMRAPGFNVFVSGPAGTCKLSSVRKILDQLPAKKRPGQDIVYLNNFTNPREPMAAKLPAGDGARLKKEMRHFVEELKSSVPSLFDHKEYKARRDELLGEYRQRQRTLFRELEQEIRDRGFAMVQVQMGQFTRPAILPLIENQPTPFEQLEQATENGNFPRTRLEQLQERQQELQGRLEAVMKEARGLDREVRDKVRELERTLAAAMLEGMVDELRGRFTHEKLVDYFDRMREFTLENLDRFKGDDETEAANPFAAFAGQMGPETDPFLEWEVNVLVDNSGDGHKPVIVENSPTYSNLFGTIEKVVTRTGQWATDFTKLRAGSILRADGGYIVFNILDAITEPGVWKTLKRLIKTREFQLETYDAFWFFMNSGIKPEPIEIDVKFIVVGEPSLYHLLYGADEDFKKLFKIRADFETVMRRTDEAIHQTAQYVARLVDEEELPDFNRKALGALVEEAVRMAGRQDKLTTRFSELADLVREAAYWANKTNRKTVTNTHVHRALESRKRRDNLYEDRIRELIDDGKLLISVEGDKVGQVNGLAVYQIAGYAFAKPTRVTVKIGFGRSGLINIEREAKLSGKTYDKGLLLLAGFLRGRYAQNKPISLEASIAFEQSYGGVDGDSASSTEAFALLSALSNVPLKQSVAVTGSINQNGEIQPIGGVNEKIEGFYLTCKARGLSGEQGVIIPTQNVNDLMLPHDLVRDVRKGKFKIWAIRDVDEGLEILTGQAAGKRDEKGRYPEGSINSRVDLRIYRLAKALQEFGKDKKTQHAKLAETKQTDNGGAPPKSPDKPGDKVPPEDGDGK